MHLGYLFFLPFCLLAHTCHLQLDHELPLTLECTGKYQLICNEGKTISGQHFAKKAKLEENSLGLIWGDDPIAYESFTLIPSSNCRILLNGSEYKGAFHFSYGHKIVHDLDADLLVQAIMEKQALEGYSLETLKALAIVIRTDLCYEDALLKASDFDYRGNAMLYQIPKIAEAVIKTRHQVMQLDEQLFPTTYCKDAAGVSANFSDMFRLSIPTPIGSQLPPTLPLSWEKSFTKQELCDLLKLESLQNLSFYTDKNSSKVYAVKIADQQNTKVLLAAKFMQLLGLKSNHFQLKTEKDRFVFTGQGEGLGVGLCLKTAESLSKNGCCYQQILQTCYPHVKITVLDK